MEIVLSPKLFHHPQNGVRSGIGLIQCMRQLRVCVHVPELMHETDVLRDDAMLQE
jgi:hypothetical protein